MGVLTPDAHLKSASEWKKKAENERVPSSFLFLAQTAFCLFKF